MNFLKKLFNREKKEDDVTILNQIPTSETRVCDIIRAECNICHKPIYMDERYTKLIGQFYHKSCWKEAKKQTWGS